MAKEVYIAGPMTGYKDWNHPRFNEMEAILLAQDDIARVVNPAKLHDHTDRPWAYYLTEDLKGLLTCNCILLLEGWERSKGATLETLVALVLGYTFLNENLDVLPHGEVKNRIYLSLLFRG